MKFVVFFNELVKLVHKNGEWNTLPGLNFTSKQLFWIAHAGLACRKYSIPGVINRKEILEGIHAPGIVRVNGGTQNLDPFAKDFNCPRGSKMNPEKKCPRLW